MTNTVSEVTITAADGQALRATVYAPAVAGTWLVINSALGVRRRFYRHFALHLQGAGIGVVTYDYRGIGESLLTDDRGRQVLLEDWGRLDFPAVLEWLRRAWQPRRLVVLGHSVGGQILGLTPLVREVDALIGLASCSGHWRHWTGLQRAAVFGLWYGVVPVMTSLYGYFPASRLGLGHDLPAGIARQWALWGRDRDYLRSESVGPRQQFYTEVSCPLRTYVVPQDIFAAEAAVLAWQAWFVNADRELVRLPVRDPAGRPLGHFGFFDPARGAGHWPGLADFVRPAPRAASTSGRQCR